VRRGDLHAQHERRDVHDQTAHGRQHERGHQDREAAPNRPVVGRRTLRLGLDDSDRRPLCAHVLHERQATQCQVENSPAKNTIASPDTARTIQVRALGRPTKRTASHMLSGNRTSKKRGRDIKGWGATG